MLRSKVGYSINPNYEEMGIETAKKSTKRSKNYKIGTLSFHLVCSAPWWQPLPVLQ